MKIDRRIKKTQKALLQALTILLRKKPLSKISISELCEEADINRNTFYYHYNYPEDILKEFQQDIIEEISLKLVRDDGSSYNLIDILKYIKTQKEFITILLSPNCDLNLLDDIFASATIQTLAITSDNSSSKIYQDYVTAYSIHGCNAIIKIWLQNGMKETPEELAEFIIKLNHIGAFRISNNL